MDAVWEGIQSVCLDQGNPWCGGIERKELLASGRHRLICDLTSCRSYEECLGHIPWYHKQLHYTCFRHCWPVRMALQGDRWTLMADLHLWCEEHWWNEVTCRRRWVSLPDRWQKNLVGLFVLEILHLALFLKFFTKRCYTLALTLDERLEGSQHFSSQVRQLSSVFLLNIV